MSDDMAAPASEHLTITTPDGVALRAEWVMPQDPIAAAVVCHPHPLYGGSMHANVVDALFRALPVHGTAVLRFNFRGAGGSSGTHDNGQAERLDVEAAIDTVVARLPGVPVLLAGYSFGADVALSVGHDAVGAWLAVAPPLRIVPVEEMNALGDSRPVHVLTGAHDQFRSPTEAEELLETYSSVTIETVDGADHFFAVGLEQITRSAAAAIGDLTA